MIAITICTTIERALCIEKKQFPPNVNCVYYFSVQGPDDAQKESLIIKHLKSIIAEAHISFISKPGLSNNRNNALKASLANANINFVYIADDDIVLTPENIIEAVDFGKRRSADLICGMVSTPLGMYKNYPDSMVKLNIFNLGKVSSVEMLISAVFLRSNSIYFDTQFGLSARYPSGEEYVFCSSILKSGGACIFAPIVFCEHPPESSGKDFFSDVNKIQGKGAMLKSIFGIVGYIICLLFALNKYKVYRGKVSLFSFIKNIFMGCYKYKKSSRN